VTVEKEAEEAEATCAPKTEAGKEKEPTLALTTEVEDEGTTSDAREKTPSPSRANPKV
jgi:hypothetical protein